MIPERVQQAIVEKFPDAQDRARAEDEHFDIRRTLLDIATRREDLQNRHFRAVQVLTDRAREEQAQLQAELDALQAICPHISTQIFNDHERDCDCCRVRIKDMEALTEATKARLAEERKRARERTQG